MNKRRGVVVVGSGGGGGVIAGELGARGHDVVLLEAGPHRLSRDFTRFELEAARHMWFPPRFAMTAEQGPPIVMVSGRCVGGSTTINTKVALRAPESDFAKWHAAAGLVGDPQVRHRGTIGGSIAHGDPASDLPTVLLALDAELAVRGPGGERAVPAGEFFRGLFETALGEQDLLTEIRVPKLGTWKGWSYIKFNRRAQDWATVGVAAVLKRDDGTIEEACVALTNMGLTPLRAKAVEDTLSGSSADAVAEAAQKADEGASPPSDTNASADYRRELARVLTRRALEEALAR